MEAFQLTSNILPLHCNAMYIHALYNGHTEALRKRDVLIRSKVLIQSLSECPLMEVTLLFHSVRVGKICMAVIC